MLAHKSWIQMAMKCPNRYKLQVIDDSPYEATGPMLFGREFHAEVDLFFDKVEVGKIRGSDEDIFQYFVSLLPDEKIYHYFAWLQTERWLDERDMFFPIETELYVKSENLRREGTIDFVLEDKDFYIIGEYKTGKFNINYVSDLRFELAFYAEMFNDAYEKRKEGKKAEWMVAYYPMVHPNGWMLCEPIKGQTYAAVKRKVQKFWDLVEGGVYEPKISILCNYCPFAKKCLTEVKV